MQLDSETEVLACERMKSIVQTNTSTFLLNFIASHFHFDTIFSRTTENAPHANCVNISEDSKGRDYSELKEEFVIALAQDSLYEGCYTCPFYLKNICPVPNSIGLNTKPVQQAGEEPIHGEGKRVGLRLPRLLSGLNSATGRVLFEIKDLAKKLRCHPSTIYRTAGMTSCTSTLENHLYIHDPNGEHNNCEVCLGDCPLNNPRKAKFETSANTITVNDKFPIYYKWIGQLWERPKHRPEVLMIGHGEAAFELGLMDYLRLPYNQVTGVDLYYRNQLPFASNRQDALEFTCDQIMQRKKNKFDLVSMVGMEFLLKSDQKALKVYIDQLRFIMQQKGILISFPLTQEIIDNLEAVGFNELFESHFYDEGITTRGKRNIYRFGLFVAK